MSGIINYDQKDLINIHQLALNNGYNSDQWTSAYTYLTANSALFTSISNIVSGTSANWNASYTLLVAKSAGWDFAYSSLSANSAAYDLAYAYVAGNSARLSMPELDTRYVNQSGDTMTGNLTVPNLFVSNDTTMYGNLSVLGSLTYLDSVITTASALSVINYGTGPALTVLQYGNQPVATFRDAEGGYVTIADTGNLGVNTQTPNEKLTVVGNLSVTGNIFGNVQLSGGSIPAAGNNGDVQFNNNGNIGADSTLNFNNVTKNLTVQGVIFSYLTGQNVSFFSVCTATNAFITIVAGTSTYALPLFRIS